MSESTITSDFLLEAAQSHLRAIVFDLKSHGFDVSIDGGLVCVRRADAKNATAASEKTPGTGDGSKLVGEGTVCACGAALPARNKSGQCDRCFHVRAVGLKAQLDLIVKELGRRK